MPLLTQKAQVTIPKKIRDLLGVQYGDEVEFVMENKRAVVKKKAKPEVWNKYAGILGRGRTEDVMKELR